ncbi:MAG: hypothetical protein ACR2G2_12580 [Pseudonocardia sp.]
MWTEFVEDGVLRGAGLIDEQARYNIALSDPTVCASQPDLRGFDVVALRPASHEVLDELVERCARLGFAHGGIPAAAGGVYLDIPDPDGTVLRFYHYTRHRHVHRHRVPRRRGRPVLRHTEVPVIRWSTPPRSG